jgi:2-polyprenyl-3-methyl-5-hydroxy-6-metoxy-1,4-benzoquinol methylase
MESLEHVYQEHHTTRRGEFFLVNGEVRGGYLKKNVGTGKRVIDIGCRDGALTKFYAEGNDVLGVDIDSAALARAHGLLGIETLHADLNGPWPFAHDADCVVACEVIEHLYYPKEVLKKIYSALKPGGWLLGSVPHAYSLQCRIRYFLTIKNGTPLQDPTHINHFRARELRKLMSDAGFINIEIEDILSPKFKFLGSLFPHTFAHSFVFKAQRPS